jgi:hypothetical protein
VGANDIGKHMKSQPDLAKCSKIICVDHRYSKSVIHPHDGICCVMIRVA